MKLSCKFLCCIVIGWFCLFAASFANGNHGLAPRDNVVPIDATKNAVAHNNLGNIYFDEKNYVAAFEEYKIAYQLTPQAYISATYLYNMARCSMYLGNYSGAQKLLLNAIQKDCMNFTYYSLLVDCYILLGTADKMLDECFAKSYNPYNLIIAGLIYQKTGNNDYARMIYQNFIRQNPDLLITEDLRAIVRKL